MKLCIKQAFKSNYMFFYENKFIFKVSTLSVHISKTMRHSELKLTFPETVINLTPTYDEVMYMNQV